MEIQFYQTLRGDYPVSEFIESAPEKHTKKILYRIDLFKELGFQKSLQAGYATNFTGNNYKGLYELTIDCGKICYRILFTMIKNTCWLLHAFKKKSNETPTKELDKANNRKKEKELENKYK